MRQFIFIRLYKRTCSCCFDTGKCLLVYLLGPGPRFYHRSHLSGRRESHYQDKTVVRQTYLYNRNLHLWDHFFILFLTLYLWTCNIMPISWRHDMEARFVLLALCVENPLVTGGIPSQRPRYAVWCCFMLAWTSYFEWSIESMALWCAMMLCEINAMIGRNYYRTDSSSVPPHYGVFSGFKVILAI